MFFSGQVKIIHNSLIKFSKGESKKIGSANFRFFNAKAKLNQYK